MYFNINKYKIKKIILLPWFFTFLSISVITLFTIIPMTSSLFVYAVEENKTFEDKKGTGNNIGNKNTNTNTNNNTKEIEKLLDIAEEYFLSGQYKKATTPLDMVLSIDGNNTDALLWKGAVTLCPWKARGGARIPNRALAIDGNNTDILFMKGAALSHFGKLQEAIEYYDKALAIDGNDTYALNNKGQVFYNLGNTRRR